ncbi:uncharacterized protein TNCV_648521 [Trichonephila clavipes]|uniref:Uncharacterized protein n=1 Tax=Trichonephila clavipes TaxID=2585209 RepID=A0A8X6VJ76_TRICX|nr:uncharacterized protein TNCV_648521 [Trichonephila clavipes]
MSDVGQYKIVQVLPQQIMTNISGQQLTKTEEPMRCGSKDSFFWPVMRIPLIKRHHAVGRKWAAEHRNRMQRDWSQVMFMDESQFSLQYDTCRVFVWGERETRNNPIFVQKNHITIGCCFLCNLIPTASDPSPRNSSWQGIRWTLVVNRNLNAIQSPDNAHSVAFSQRFCSPHLIKDGTFNDNGVINNLIDYEDGQEEPDSLRTDTNMQGSCFPTNW